MEKDIQEKNSNPSLVKKPTKKSITGSSFQLLLIIILIILGGVGLVEAFSTNKVIEQKSSESKESARPADLEVITVTDKNCADCSTLTNHLNLIKSKNAKITKETNLDLQDKQAQDLIAKYSIKKIPFLVATGEINKNEDVKALWDAWGGAKENEFVLTNVFPPYLNLENNKVEGRVSITYLGDKSCSECYDVMLHKNILTRNYGVKIVSEKNIDIADAEGKELLTKYNITQVPTFLTDPEIAVYRSLATIWPQVGSTESDNTYVFRKPEQVGNYFDLSKKELIKLKTATNTNINQNTQ